MKAADLKKARKALNLTQKQVAELIGVSFQTYNGYENGKEIPNTKYQILDNVLSLSSDTPKITLDVSNVNQNSILTNQNSFSRIPKVITISEKDEEKENIELVPVKLAAGYVGGGFAEENFIRELPKFRLPFLNNGTFRCFGVGGHSMDKIQDEDWFIGRFVSNLRDFHEGKVHAIISKKSNSLLLKRVFRHPERNDMLILRSDGNDIVNTYPDIHIHMDLIDEIWSYAALISFKEPAYDINRFREILLSKPKATVLDK
ncbi:hypothetical protein ATE49_12900 [Elizabethkingia miricola]|uniref:Helix-turn-helix protein n=1 Tax=Elizabethkingia miricola TaxID=172045 RepID=A0ABY3NC29_ELIMR|nr:helix-turn-helix transcriptional regulator [Elizabethkingia miricola]MCT4288679.1 helix-turn-helix transcriptional regulator [Elizabethkingia anophelis]OBS13341.1 hypothetical protein ATE49_12900 [Elizabethkingia miricola]TYO84968.1 helix-turn-helix protein [Elizabethkingia miricola]